MRRAARPGKRSKYGVRTDAIGKAARTVDGILFASMKEALRYSALKLLEKAGEIESLELQPKFELHAKNGIRVGRYVADFSYLDSAGKRCIEDSKGFQTELFVWKKRHVESEYGIKVELV